MDMRLQDVHHLLRDRGCGLARFRSCADGRSHLEQLSLNLLGQIVYFFVTGDAARKSHLRDQLVDSAIAFYSWIGFRNAHAARQAGGAAVASFCRNTHFASSFFTSDTDASTNVAISR